MTENSTSSNVVVVTEQPDNRSSSRATVKDAELGRDTPVSLHGVDPDDAVRALLSTPHPDRVSGR